MGDARRQDGSAAMLQRDCAAEVAAGPRPLTPEELASARYGVTDLLTDLEGATDRDEQAAIGSALWQQTAGLLLTGWGHWTGTGKGLVRELRLIDRAGSTTYTADLVIGLRSALAGDPSSLINTCDRILGRFGGRRFEGHRLGGEHPGPSAG